MGVRAKKVTGGTWWSQEKKVQAVTTYLAVGNAPMTEAITGVPRGTIRQWRMQNWWRELEADIRNEEDYELDVKLSKIIDKSLDAVMDRVENGDFLFDSKTGKFVRKPVHMKDALAAVTQVFDKRNLLRGKPTSRVEKQNVTDNLAKLAAEFAKFANAKQIEGEVIESKDDDEEVGRESSGQQDGQEVRVEGRLEEGHGDGQESDSQDQLVQDTRQGEETTVNA